MLLYRPRRVRGSAQIVVASSLDTLRSGFGAYILSPSVAKGLTGSFALTIPWKRHKYGLYAQSQISRTTWGTDANDLTKASSAVVIGLASMSYYEHSGVVSTTRVSIALFGGPSLRILAGDIAAQDSLRRTLLGNDRTLFGGLEFGARLTVGGLSSIIQVYYYGGRKVAGLTAGQVSAAFTVAAPILEGPLATDD